MLTACATSSSKMSRSDFEDIPVPAGLTYRQDESTVIETPRIRAGRQVYRGRLTIDSLSSAIRTTLEANGWRHVSTQTSNHGTTQVYEKEGDSLQVLLWEGTWYTYAEYTTGRVVKTAK